MRRKKKEDIFFTEFKEFSAMIVKTSEVFHDLVHNYEDVENKVVRIKDMETACDKKAHEILRHLAGSFVTPFDREDIYDITRQMDEIVDCMEEASNRFYLFNVHEIQPGAVELVDKLCEAVCQLDIMFQHLSEMTKSSVVMDQVIEVNRLENEGDELHRQVLYRLFREETDGAELFKWYHLYQRMEGSLDACETVANIVEGVIMKYA